MGQPIELTSIVLGDVAVFDGDRSITGQDGSGFTRAEVGADGVPARLAARLFEADGALEHVFVASSQVVARRSGDWDDEAVAAVSDVIRGFFVFYG
jgi:hypothetical protein